MTKPHEPLRLTDDASTDDGLAAALRSAQSGPGPRALERLSLTLGVTAPLAPPPVPPASGLAAVSGSSFPTLGIVALVGAVGAGAAVGLAPAPRSYVPAPARVAPVTQAKATPERAEPPESEPTALPEAPRPSEPAPPPRQRRREPERTLPEASAPPTPEAPPAPAPIATDTASRLREEALLVKNAERLLGSDPSRALSLTEERRRRFPGGALDQEAEVVAIDALLRLGRRDAAASRARQFETRHPGSLHARRIRALFGSDL